MNKSNFKSPASVFGRRKWLSRSACWLVLFSLLFLIGCNAKGARSKSEKNTKSGDQTAATSETNPATVPASEIELARQAKPLPAIGLQTKQLTSPIADATGSFTRLDNEATGLSFTNQLQPKNMRKYLLNGAGLCTGDYNNDGLVDVFAVSQDGANRLFRQVAPWKFEDATKQAGDLSGGSLSGTGASFADINNDGWLDLYVCNINGPNQLFINQQDGTFSEEAASRNVASAKATTMASLADYDLDGDLDLYLVNNRVYALAEESPKAMLRKIGNKRVVHPDFKEQYFIVEGRIQEAGQRDQLLQNDGQGNFRDVTDAAGIDGFDMGLSATWWDYNEDGHPDLYVGNDLKSPDHLYRNEGNGKFTDVIAEAAPHTPWFSMGADAADINNDGLLDLLVADMSSTTHYKQKTTMGEMGNSAWFLTTGKPRQFMRNTLLLNSGTERFFEAANLTGLDSTDWSWSIKFADFDSDGMVDVFVTNGVGRNMNDSDSSKLFSKLFDEGKKEEAYQLLMKMPPLNEANLAFRNQGDLRFQKVAKDWGVDHLGVSQGASVADIDGDGDLDLLVSNMNEPLGVYRNDISGQNRIAIQLKGVRSNTFGVGARVTMEIDGLKQIRELKLASGFMSADAPALHFGVGAAEIIDKLEVKWPSGTMQQFKNVAANQLLTITEGSEGLVKTEKNRSVEYERPHSSVSQVFHSAKDSTGIQHKHREFEYDDFSVQPLLPNKLSQLGPGLAWGDVNNDGRDDFFVGASAGQVASLYVQNRDGRFAPSTSRPWTEHRGCEDLGCLFFDVDADGDQDLYVASGGYERKAGSPYLKDRLYLNDGKGNFETSDGSQVPSLTDSSSCVSAADYDRDGDLDLFVGTRLLPAQWPLPASSRLLKNDNGRLVEANEESASVLNDIGLVTSAIWSDVDGDGWIDLLLATEWDSIRYLKNEQGKLVDWTQQSGLAKYKGWWNSINAGDIDNDGDMDYVVMNVGLNTKYHATDERPVVLFANDFDQNGVLDLIEAEYEGDVCYPVRGKSCSSHAMPFLNDKFDTFHEFALADVSTIYTDESLNESRKFEANWLQSSILINDGAGKFAVKPLPRMAQIAPGFGTVLQDYNGDGNLDLLIAQNFMQPQPETGQMDGGMGMFLFGDGNGGFRFLPSWYSGFKNPGQGMALTTVDYDGDAGPDLLLSVNNDAIQPQLFQQRFGDSTAFKFRLKGEPGNPTAVGASVTYKTKSGAVSRIELHAGKGYLSQSSPDLFFVDRIKDGIQSLVIRWPDGSEQTEDFKTLAGRRIVGSQEPVVVEKAK